MKGPGTLATTGVGRQRRGRSPHLWTGRQGLSRTCTCEGRGLSAGEAAERPAPSVCRHLSPCVSALLIPLSAMPREGCVRLRGTRAPTKNGGEPPSHRLALPERRERHDGSAAHGGENDEDEGPENRGMALCLVVERREEGWEKAVLERSDWPAAANAPGRERWGAIKRSMASCVSSATTAQLPRHVLVDRSAARGTEPGLQRLSAHG